MKTLKGFMIFMLSLSLFAGVVPQEKLDNVNAYIKVLLSDYSDLITISVTSAETNDKTKKLEKINMKADMGEYGNIDLSLALVKTEVKLNGNYTFLDTDGEYTNPKEIEETLREALEYADVINKKGIYKATVKSEENNKGTLIELILEPASDKAESINKITSLVFLPKNHKEEKVSFSFQGSFNAKADLVSTAQDGLTGIFTDLANQKEPKESDYDKLGEVIDAIFTSLEETE